MVEAQDKDGFFGNVYSTPWAMQVGVMGRGPVGWVWAWVQVWMQLWMQMWVQGPNPPSSLLLPGLHCHQHMPDASGV